MNLPGLMGFVQYCIFNMGEDHVLYGGKLAMKMGTDQLLNWLDSVERSMLKAEARRRFLRARHPSRSWWKSPRASSRWVPRWARAGC